MRRWCRARDRPWTSAGPADLARAADDAAKEAQIEAEGAKAGAADPVDADEAAAKAAKLAAGGAAPEKQPPGIAPAPRTGQPGDIAMPPGDPIVAKVRTLLELGHATVLHRERHDGVSTWAIGLKEGIGGPSWRLWVDASSGRPIELRDPGRDANKPAQVIRWQTYEVLRQGGDATALLTLRGAHPTAQVVHDPAQWQAAEQRLALVRP